MNASYTRLHSQRTSASQLQEMSLETAIKQDVKAQTGVYTHAIT